MTKEEEKELLTKVLCEQLPYNVKVHCKWFMFQDTTPTEDIGVLVQISNKKALVERQNQTTEFYLNSCGCSILPYLRPLSSMTNEEKETYQMFFNEDGLVNTSIDTYVDWLLEGHFDFRGLIEKGLAIAAVGDDNPYKEKGGGD